MKRKCVEIVGSHHYNATEYIRGLSPGETLELRPEPTNEYDCNAVEIYHLDKKLGYIPRTFSYEIAKSIKQGYIFHCEIRKKFLIEIHYHKPMACFIPTEEEILQ